jgi:hypothetical protein
MEYEVKQVGSRFKVWSNKANDWITHACTKDIADEICEDFNKMANKDFSPIGGLNFSIGGERNPDISTITPEELLSNGWKKEEENPLFLFEKDLVDRGLDKYSEDPDEGPVCSLVVSTITYGIPCFGLIITGGYLININPNSIEELNLFEKMILIIPLPDGAIAFVDGIPDQCDHDWNGDEILWSASGKIIYWHTYRQWAHLPSRERYRLISDYHDEIEDPVTGGCASCSKCKKAFSPPTF